MFRDLFKPRKKSDDVCQLVAGIISRQEESPDLGTRLETLVEVLAGLPGHTGAMVIAFDSEGLPFCYRCRGISLCEDGASPFTTLTKLREIQLEESSRGTEWIEVSSTLVQAPHAAGITARLLRSADREPLLGMILIAYRSKTIDMADFEVLASDEALRFLEWTLRDAIHLDSLKLQVGLHRLATDQLSVEQLPIETSKIADGLLRILKADAVTLLVDRLGQCFLSATTDSVLRKAAETFNIDQDLTTFALGTCRPIRLRDATDAEEVKKQAAAEATPNSLEALTHSGDPYRLLIVPMRARQEADTPEESTERATGAIRILRDINKQPFTHEEGRSLQAFANLLGAELDASWILQIYGHIRRANSEAICISCTPHQQQEEDKKREPVLVYVNPGAQELFGLDRGEILGRPARTLYSSEVEYERIRQLLTAAIKHRDPEYGPIESRVNTAGGHLAPVSISFRFVEPNVKPSVHYTISVIRDISKQHKLAEQHHRLMDLLDKEGLAYFLAGEDGKTIAPTTTDSRLTGYSATELITTPRERFYVDPEKRRVLIQKVLGADGDLVPTLQHLRRKDGTAFFAEGVIHLLKDGEDRRIGYEGLYEDVTERITLQGFLDADTDKVMREKELLESLKANVEFHLLYTKSLGHQLRTPLGAILHTLLNMKERLSGDKKWERRLKYAIGQAQTWRRLIDNLAFMDKLLRGEDFPFEPINLAKLAIETKVDFEYVLPEKKLRLHIDDSSIDRLVTSGNDIWGNDGLLRQALVNLVDNAIKYSHPETEIKVRGYEAGMQGRVLEISNQGIRVPKEERGDIFNRGYRTKQAQDSAPDGFGIGLWLVRKIVAAHGGTIRCAETADLRTAFRIYFPYEALRRSVRLGG